MFVNLRLLLVLGNRDRSTRCLQNDLETDEDDGKVLTAKNGTKWKQVQVRDKSTVRISGNHILREKTFKRLVFIY